MKIDQYFSYIAGSYGVVVAGLVLLCLMSVVGLKRKKKKLQSLEASHEA